MSIKWYKPDHGNSVSKKIIIDFATVVRYIDCIVNYMDKINKNKLSFFKNNYAVQLLVVLVNISQGISSWFSIGS